MASIMTYFQDVEQFARVPQLRKAMEDALPLIEETTNFILRYTSRSRISKYPYVDSLCIDSNYCRSYSQRKHLFIV
jgi:hypothetical protein